MNFAMDRTGANWAKVLAETRAKAGPCEIAAPVQPDGAMSGAFTWPCANGKIAGTLTLAPTRPITLQSLSYTFKPGD